jgi:DNA-binding transcriptional regulator PaaX
VELGFGKWQRSVYVTPNAVMNEINEYLQEKNLFGMVVCFESRRVGFGNDREFADEIFRLGKINRQYGEILKMAEALEYIFGEKHISKEAFEQRFRKIWSQYIELVLADPYLPAELLPRDWQALKTRVAMGKLAGLI